ncbi:CaiB/BaiF CoA transferase family protein [Nocardioides halotolerans]|uniref:CaiB/BaiF CoA transferase family protein n=1 Tax=Nocardioides halotolerans TaxID=433660 RepID=UPI001FDEBC38|nr:CaiB/BaiF CoA-transferase family protein [Nocardioides halotolerans]
MSGYRVVEIGSIGPGPFCAMLLADLGADIIRVDRASGSALVGPSQDFRAELLHRGRRSVAVDLKHPEGRAVVMRLVEGADALVEGFRPGVAERLGIGPDDCQQVNPRLVYGRMTGYGQTGPWSQVVGHDLNYVAMSGVQAMIGRQGQPPTPPLSLVGDFGGGGLVLAFGILAALLERGTSGRGQVVDAAMVEGAATLAVAFHGFVQSGAWALERGTNIVDSGSPFYDLYETSDGKWLSVAAMEPHFYADLVQLLGLTDLPDQHDRAAWPEMKTRFAGAIRTKTRDQWVAEAEPLNACVAPVLGPDEVMDHPHHRERGSFVEVGGVVQPAPVPRFDRTPAELRLPPPLPGEHTVEGLQGWGVPDSDIQHWLSSGAIKAGG